MRNTVIALVIGCLVLAAMPAHAQERQRLKIVIPAGVLTASQAPPYSAAPRQSKSHTIAAIVVVSAIVVLGVVVISKYAD